MTDPNTHRLAEQINAVLPQTQCELCEHKGCLPYAEAIAQGEDTIDKCAPGGLEVLRHLAEITQQDPTPFIRTVSERAKPPMLAVIREAECIGCTKCIQACPVDAIMGAAKHMHSVINRECTGCELCIPPCPVDCIDIIALLPQGPAQKKEQAAQFKKRYEARNQRLQQQAQEKHDKHQKAKLDARKAAIAAAVQRAKAKLNK